jgi:type IV pilus assembly protein PilP
MKRVTWSLAAGAVILMSGIVALFISAGVVKAVRAQDPAANPSPPAADLPPPAADLPPPTADLPAPGNLPPPSELPPAQGAAPEQMGAPPDPNAMPPAPVDANAAPPAPTEGAPPEAAPGQPAIPTLDASQDPGLKTLNPEGFVYDPSGRRDPFFPTLKAIPQSLAPTEAGVTTPAVPATQPTVSPEGETPVGNGDPLLSYYLRDYKLIGVLWEVRDPKAMIRAPNNRVYTIRLKMKLGRENAVVAAIREREIVVVEPDEKGNYLKGEPRTIRMRN